jgi:hypothetical protein
MKSCAKGLGKVYSNKGEIVFVATGNSGCPTIKVTHSKSVRFRDDYSKGFKVSKALAKSIFR